MDRVAHRLGFAAVLTTAALLLTSSLTVSGYGNGYYAQAALAASHSWTALLTNAADQSGLASVAKGPLSDWMMGLSARAFGFTSLSLLAPNALCALAAVALLYDAARRCLDRPTALLAALMLALSPVSVMMGRYDNPDALLALLLVAAAWALVRSLQSGRTRHVLLCGALVGLGFETKMLEAYLIVPGLACAFALAAPGSPRRRVGQLLAGACAMAAVSVAWYATLTLIAAGDRPRVPESSGDSWFGLIFDANGLKRLVGYPGGGQGASGPLRLFSAPVAGQVAWLLPLALAGLLAGLWQARDRPRTDLPRAALVLFGLWLAVGYAVLSFSRGIFHSYYTSAIAPAVALLAADAVVSLARRARAAGTSAGLLLATALAGTAALSFAILARTPGFVPWLRWTVLGAGVLTAASSCLLVRGGAATRRTRAVALGARLDHAGRVDQARRLLPATLAAVAAAIALLGGPAAYSIATAGFGRVGASPKAGPASLTPRDDRAGAVGGTSLSALASHLERMRGGARYLVAATGSDFSAPIALDTRAATVTLGGFDGQDRAPSAAQLASLVAHGELRYVLLAVPANSPAARARERWVVARCAVVSAPYLANGLLGENGAWMPGRGRSPAPGAVYGLYRCG